MTTAAPSTAPTVTSHLKHAGQQLGEAGSVAASQAQEAWKHLSTRVQTDGFRKTFTGAVKNHKLAAGVIFASAVAATVVGMHHHRMRAAGQEQQRATDLSR